MAHMIPLKPKEIDEKSNEGTVFNILKTRLDDDFYVFHSVSEVEVLPDNQYFEREIDFVIAHKKKGILCIEVKGGSNIHYADRTWYYSNGLEMNHGGPYHQIATAKRTIKNKVEYHKNVKVRNLVTKCRFFHAVMFPDLSCDSFNSLQGLPEEADPRITICSEDMLRIQEKVLSIFDCILPWEKHVESETDLTDGEFKLLLDSVLCPHFHLIPSPNSLHLMAEEKMNQLLREQYIILDFLDEQQIAVVNGAAGTGKTMLAVEKAARHSENDEKVLFLCYNTMLCKHLTDQYLKNPDRAFSNRYRNINFSTISKLAYEKVHNYSGYDQLLEWLLDCADKKYELGYKHIIVDEGQDFGMIDSIIDATTVDSELSAEDGCSIIDALQEAALANEGTFYLFYDKYQMVQGGGHIEYSLPDCIENCDCRLTLHKNCRNTSEIARTSVTPLKDNKNKAIKPNTACSWGAPCKPVIHIFDDPVKAKDVLDNTIDSFVGDDYSEIVILSAKSIKKSWILEVLDLIGKDTYEYRRNGKAYPVTTCRKFKGLEADAIILIDVDRDTFINQNGYNFYVGTSRAKHRLECLFNLAKDDYKDIAQELDPNSKKTNNSERMLRILGSIFCAEVDTVSL